MKYEIGLIFKYDEDYKNKAIFCNENNLIIVELEKDSEGNRVFQIQEPKLTKKELNEQEMLELKQKLYDTDYIASKLAEATARYFATDDKTELQQLTEKYADVMTERQKWRERVDQLISSNEL